MVISVRFPNSLLSQMNEIRRAWGHSIPSIIRKSVNAAIKRGVVLSDYCMTTTRTNSMPVQIAVPDTFKMEGKDVVAAVNWYANSDTVQSALTQPPPEIKVEAVEYILEEVE